MPTVIVPVPLPGPVVPVGPWRGIARRRRVGPNLGRAHGAGRFDVFVPPTVLSVEFAQVGDPGLWAKVHWMLPVGGAVVLLGGTTVAVNVRVSPRVGVGRGRGGRHQHGGGGRAEGYEAQRPG